nr:MAG TPA: hypothetical protein [Caudoviricetes sp.]
MTLNCLTWLSAHLLWPRGAFAVDGRVSHVNRVPAANGWSSRTERSNPHEVTNYVQKNWQPCF